MSVLFVRLPFPVSVRRRKEEAIWPWISNFDLYDPQVSTHFHEVIARWMCLIIYYVSSSLVFSSLCVTLQGTG